MHIPGRNPNDFSCPLQFRWKLLFQKSDKACEKNVTFFFPFYPPLRYLKYKFLSFMSGAVSSKTVSYNLMTYNLTPYILTPSRFTTKTNAV